MLFNLWNVVKQLTYTEAAGTLQNGIMSCCLEAAEVYMTCKAGFCGGTALVITG